MSVTETRFAASILEHLPALCALTASSVVSYLRLKPHYWSAGFGYLGDRDREATIRIPPTENAPGADRARQFNLEFRAADAAACPHLALAVLVLAGMRGIRGIREELSEPSLVKGDPSGLGEEDRRRLGVRPLPASLEEALEAPEGDASVRSWLSRDLFDCYVGVKRAEISLLEGADPRGPANATGASTDRSGGGTHIRLVRVLRSLLLRCFSESRLFRVTVETLEAGMGGRRGTVEAGLYGSLYCAVRERHRCPRAQRAGPERRDVLYGWPRTGAGPDALL